MLKSEVIICHSVVGLPSKRERMTVSSFRGVESNTDIANKILTLGENYANIKLDNRTVRKLYADKVSNISSEIDKTKILEEQARQAFDLRNKYRTHAMALMAEQKNFLIRITLPLLLKTC